MDLAAVLDATEMEKARTPAEFVAWVEQKRCELNAITKSKAIDISGDPLVKKFYDEVFPLSRFSTHEYVGRNDVLIRYKLGNDNFDAHVTLGSGLAQRNVFLELTYAKDGRDLSLRLEVLANKGGVFLTGPVTVTGGRKGSPNRRVSVEPVAADHIEIIKNYFTLIGERLRAKSGVSYGDDHVLLVAVDDYYALSKDSDWPKLKAFADSLLPTLRLDFPRVVFVGTAGRLFLSWFRNRI